LRPARKQHTILRCGRFPEWPVTLCSNSPRGGARVRHHPSISCRISGAGAVRTIRPSWTTSVPVHRTKTAHQAQTTWYTTAAWATTSQNWHRLRGAPHRASVQVARGSTVASRIAMLWAGGTLGRGLGVLRHRRGLTKPEFLDAGPKASRNHSARLRHGGARTMVDNPLAPGPLVPCRKRR